MTDLLKRLQSAGGADRSLDQAIWCHVDSRHKPVGKDQYTFDDGQVRWRGFKPVPELTASLDAAIALVEECLPGWAIKAEGPTWRYRDQMRWNYLLKEPHKEPEPQSGYLPSVAPERQIFDGDHESPAIALLIALLRALETGGRGWVI